MKRTWSFAIPAFLLAVSAAQAAGDPAAGEGVYNKTCKMCHATGMLSAPKTGDAAAWTARIAQGEAVLIESVKNGKGKMPARGACSSCSDEDLVNAVAYLVSQAH